VRGAGQVMKPELAGLRISDAPQAWEALGFTVIDGTCELGGVSVTLGVPNGDGIVGWVIRGIEPSTTEIDGLPTAARPESAAAPQPAPTTPTPALQHPHPNGAMGIDHVVVVTPNFGQTSEALSQAGMPLKRTVGEPPSRMGFRRLGPAILELVENERVPITSFWGLVIVVSDFEGLAARIPEHLGAIRDAVQPGRRIATLKPTAGLRPAVAFMDPERSHPEQ
jgi:hypothetical protein